MSITQSEALQMAREANRWAANQTDDSYDFPQIRDERLVQAAYQRGLEDAATLVREHVWHSQDQERAVAAIRTLKGGKQ